MPTNGRSAISSPSVYCGGRDDLVELAFASYPFEAQMLHGYLEAEPSSVSSLRDREAPSSPSTVPGSSAEADAGS